MNVRFRRQFFQRPEGEDLSTGGGAVATPEAAATGGDVAPVAADPVTTEGATAAPAPAEPASMLEAMTNAISERARDELGRFTKAEADALAAAAGKPAAPAQPAAVSKQAAGTQPPADPAKASQADLAMPEGLQPKAQQRFQALANEIKELRPALEQAAGQVNYVKQVFAEHQVKPEQFDMAMSAIGALNRGDFQAALQVLDQQRQMIALAMGQPLPDVDPLASFPDLRQAVDNYQMTLPVAMELAKGRFGQQQAQQAAQVRQQQQAQQEAQQRQAHAYQQERQQAEREVTEFCERMQRTDLDFAAIDAQLQPVIVKLLEGVRPSMWRQVVETQYELLKQSATRFRAPSTPSPVRPLGQPSPAQAPQDMFEAMFGKSRPAA